MLRQVINFRDGIKTPEINIYPDWKNPTKEELHVSKYLNFNIKSYNVVRQSFDILKPAFDVLKLLKVKDRKLLFEMFFKIKEQDIDTSISCSETKSLNTISRKKDFKEFELKIDEFLDNTSKIILEYFQKTNIVEVTRNYVVNQISFPDLSKAGTRPQDSKKTTFFESDYVELTTLSILCKLLTPVFGEIIYWYNKSSYLDKSTKEISAAKILNRVLDTYFHYLRDKLFYYIETRVNIYFDTENINTLYKGFNSFKMKLYILAIILCKKLINANLLENNKNIMTYINKCIKSTLTSQVNSLKKDDKVMERFPIKTNQDDEQESDLIEHETGRAVRQIGTLLFVSEITKNFIELITNNLVMDDILIATRFYEENKIKVNSFAEYMIGHVMSRFMGSGKIVKLMNLNSICTIISTCQIILSADPKNEEILHLISANVSNNVKLSKSPSDYRIRYVVKTSEMFRSISASIINQKFRDEWENYIDGMADTLSSRIITYQTAPIIWEKYLNMENRNEHPYQYQLDIIDRLFGFSHYELGSITERRK